MKEYDEKQKEVLKDQQQVEMAKQHKKHQITTIASLAKAHGVFNRNPNQRNEQEDDSDFDPLQIRSPRPGPYPYGDPPGGDEGGGGGGPPNSDSFLKVYKKPEGDESPEGSDRKPN